MDRKEIKAKAKEFSFNNKWNIWKPLLLIMLICFAVELLLLLLAAGVDVKSPLYSFFTSIIDVAIIPASIGYIYYLIKLINGKKVDVKEDLLSKYNLFALIIGTTIVVSIFASLWAILLIVPGIIYSFKMAMVDMLLADKADEKTTIKSVMDTSKEMMDGYKMDFFVFNLSFIGWYLLGAVTFGIAFIWVVPYVTTANIMYYQELLNVKKIKKLK